MEFNWKAGAMMKKEKWFFTFDTGQDNYGYYVVIEGDYSEARDKMREKFGIKWGFQYSEEQWKRLEDCYKGQEMNLNSKAGE